MSEEVERNALSGWLMLAVNLGMYIVSIYLFVTGVVGLDRGQGGLGMMIGGISLLLLSIFTSIGFIIVQPNQAGVLVLFGKYSGSVKQNGFWWVNPLMSKLRISLRARNLNGERLKVNDNAGNPIEIALVVVWRVKDTFSALFDVDDYEHYVQTQSESALRHLASSYPYDSWEEKDENTISLRGDIDKVSLALEKELTERLWKAGVAVEEARLSHLAYSPEVAEAMLKRQQASAIVAARQKIVEGAVGMVEMALDLLEKDGVVTLDEERKATMVSNLLVVLCGEKEAHPVINTGTLYG